MLSQDSSLKMSNRSGLPVKNIVTAIFILLSVYLLYIYNVAQNRLHDAEMTGSRYRREAEERVNEIQELVAAKDDYQERCENEKRESNNKLKAMNQKHAMLQSHNTEIEADFSKLQQDMDNLRTEHMQTESQHAQEYQNLKRTKEKEIQELTGQLSSMKEKNDELQNTITTLRSQLQNSENEVQKALQMVENLQMAKKNLVDQNAQLQLMQFQQQKQLQLQQENDANAKQAQVLEQQQKQLQVGSEQKIDPLNQSKDVKANQNENVDLMSQNKFPQGAAADDKNIFGQGIEDSKDKAAKIDELNVLNQAKPPGLNKPEDNVDDADDVAGENENRPAVNPNDEQKGQILEPLKQDGGEVDGEGRNKIGELEERRENEEMENQEHKGPLALGQMQHPFGMEANDQPGENNEHKLGGDLGQQQAPVFVEQKQGVDNKAEDGDEPRRFFPNREEDEGNLEGEDELLDVRGQKEVDEPMKAWNHFNMGNNKEEENDDMDVNKYDDNPAEKDTEEEEEDVDDYGADDDNPDTDV